MPKVESHRFKQTRLQGYQGSYTSRANANDFGAQVGAATKRAADTAFAIQHQINAEKDQADLKKAERELGNMYTDLNRQYKTTKMQEADDGWDKYQEDMEKSYQTVRESMPKHLHERFSLLSGGLTDKYHNYGADHRMGQREAYLDYEAQQSVAFDIDQAAANPNDLGAINEHLGNIQMEVYEGRLGRGMGPNEQDVVFQQQASKLHQEVVESMLANGDVAGAQTHLHLIENNKAFEGQVDQDTLQALKTKLKPRVDLRDAQQAVEDLPPGTSLVDGKKLLGDQLEGEALEKAKAIHEDNIRDAEYAKTIQKKENLEFVADKVDELGSLAKVEQQFPDQVAGLDKKDRELMSACFASVSSPDSLDYLYGKVDQGLTRSEVRKHQKNLTAGDYKMFLNSAVDGGGRDKRAKADQPNSVISKSALINSTLDKYGIKTGKKANDEDIARKGLLTRRFTEELDNFHKQNKRDATPLEEQEIMDKLAQRVYIDEWGRDPQLPAGAVLTDERGDAYVPIDEIPQDDRAGLVAQFNSLGINPTEDLLQQAYGAYLVGDRERYRAILSSAGNR